MKEITSPHDAFVKFVLSIPGVAAQLLGLLPKQYTQYFDLTTLKELPNSYISEDLREFFSDKVFECKKNEEGSDLANFSFLLEHKSYPYKHLRVQLTLYLALKALAEIKDGKEPTFTLPVLLYHGLQKWNKRSLLEEFPLLPTDLHKFVAALDYFVIDLTAMSDEEILKLQQSPLVNMLLIIKHHKEPAYLSKELDKIFIYNEIYQSTEPGRAFLWELLVYYFKTSQLSGLKDKSIIHKLPQIMQTTALSTWDNLILEGKAEEQTRITRHFILRFPTWTDQEIADSHAVSVEFVKNIRKQLIKEKAI
jgi:hypothetical protein